MVRIRQSLLPTGPVLLLLLVCWATTTLPGPVAAQCDCAGEEYSTPPPQVEPFDMEEKGMLSLHEQYEFPLPFYGTTNITIEASAMFPAANRTSAAVELPVQVLLIREGPYHQESGLQSNQTLFTVALPSASGEHSTPALVVEGGDLVVIVRVIAVPESVQPQGQVTLRLHGITESPPPVYGQCKCAEPDGPTVPGFDVAITLLAMLGVGAAMTLRHW